MVIRLGSSASKSEQANENHFLFDNVGEENTHSVPYFRYGKPGMLHFATKTIFPGQKIFRRRRKK